ncbi:hypothetical protein VCRLGP8_110028 [Vibrio crassostreae]|nr:hypothetical protein VCRA2113O354_190027 [Vibrio crassostreae]CAK2516049.1 hypothetical protein VCRA2113O360_40401 [Vibrio crassostreae]CDS98474.1 hypothetical protein VCRLGP107_160026 [Vibrio crassostreae]CDT05133.1 hypothetical protein VCRLGP8_110028 [Vibrio crassostreae]CDT42950.1 hypothetical protein VCRLGP7_710026 [Vibrio crassostreae]
MIIRPSISDDCHLQLYVDIVGGDSFYQYQLLELSLDVC